MAMESHHLSDPDLYAYSHAHVRYELWMLLRLGEYFIKAEDPVREWGRVMANAMIESFVIHLRNLITFLYSERLESKDVMAADFFDDPEEWLRKRPLMSPNLRRARTRSHREVVHLTTDRIAGTPPKKMWPVRILVQEIQELMTLFCDSASPAKLHPSIKDLLSKQPS
jgi:hypothetical protein